MSTYETITIEHPGHVALVTLNRPDKLTAWDTVMREEFVRGAREVNADSNVRAVVLAGAGRAFSAPAATSVIERNSPNSRATQASSFSASSRCIPGLEQSKDQE